MPNTSSPTARNPRAVVVGVDGSSASIEALRWAVGQTQIEGAPIEAVYVLASAPLVGAIPTRPLDFADDLRVAQAAGDELARTVRRAVGEADADRIQAMVVASQSVVGALREISDSASYLVVGAGRGSIDGAALGSTTAEVLRQAHCPVVVIPEGVERPTDWTDRAEVLVSA